MTSFILATVRPTSTHRFATCIRPGLIVHLLLLISIALAGCTRFDAEYGASDGASGTQSLNGFGAFRTALEQAPAADAAEILTRDAARLSGRESQSDAIVWIPTDWPPGNLLEIQDWLDQWLTQNQRTLIFIVPDDGSTEAYFREAASFAPPQQRLNYRRRLARLINERSLAEAERSDVSLGRWFTAAALRYNASLPDRQRADFSLQESKVHLVGSTSPTHSQALPRRAAKSRNFVRTPVASEELEDFRFEPLMRATAPGPTGPASLTTLARITCDRWNDSQLLVVASGALVTNFAMTGTAGRKLTNRIRDEIQLAGDAGAGQAIEVAFLSSDDRPILVSDSEPEVPRTRGWELMTEMPLSLINLHVAFLGIVLCLMLLPVFGRPRRVLYNDPTHFGNHLSAMATLMRRSGSTTYAKLKISEYLRHVRGETSGPWVLPPSDSADSEQPRETQP